MHKLLALLAAFNIFAAEAASSCLLDGTCFEYDGQIIDLRSTARQNLDKVSDCEPLIESCGMKTVDAEAPRLTKSEFQKLIGQSGTQYFIPIDVNSSDLIILAGALSLGTVVFGGDREIMDFVQENKGEYGEPIADVGNMLGREAILPIAAGAYFMGAVLNDGKLKNIGMFTITAGLATQIVAEGFKKTFQRVRPHDGDSPSD